MPFKNDVPNYKNLESDTFHMDRIPAELWTKLEAYIPSTAEDQNQLKHIINSLNALALIPQTTNWGWNFLIQDLSDTFSQIRKEGKAKFPLLMDSIAVIARYGGIEELNELLEEYNVGYLLAGNKYTGYKWRVRENIESQVDGIEDTKEIVKSVSEQAFERLEHAANQLSKKSSARELKNSLFECVSAMENIIKIYGETDDIKTSTKNLRDSKEWGKDEIVKDGASIFNRMHELYPDLRHGSRGTSLINFNEAKYWIDRINSFIQYLVRAADTLKSK